MIDGVGKKLAGGLETLRAAETAKAVPAGQARPHGRPGGVESSVAGLVAAGPPVDSEKVAMIRAAIAEGRYPVDAERIAERMIALDLDRRDA